MSSSDEVSAASAVAALDRARRRRVGTGAAIVLVLAITAIAVVVGMLRSGAAAPAESVAVAVADPTPPPVYVHVSGAVEWPGLYRLDDGARVVDVVAAAGGLSDDADATAINLARPLTDGEQLHVPRAGETAAPAAAANGDGRVNLNTADAAALDALPRVGPAIAERIISWRTENGRFTSVDDLLSVPGIGEKMLAGLRDRVTV